MQHTWLRSFWGFEFLFLNRFSNFLWHFEGKDDKILGDMQKKLFPNDVRRVVLLFDRGKSLFSGKKRRKFLIFECKCLKPTLNIKTCLAEVQCLNKVTRFATIRNLL